MRRATRDAGGNRGQGGKWIRPEKRRRIYERDGWRCLWCSIAVACNDAAGALACLDHVLPRERGGSNHESNLVTSCMSCNAARGTRSAVDFAWDCHYPYAALNRVITAMGAELPPRAALRAKRV